MNFSEAGITRIYNEADEEIGFVKLSDPISEFGDDAPFYFGKWIVIADIGISPRFRGRDQEIKIVLELVRWAESSGKQGILVNPNSVRSLGLSGDDAFYFYRSLGFKWCDAYPNLMEKKLRKPMVLNLYSALNRLGFYKEAADLKELIPDMIKEDPLTTAFAFGNLNIGSFVESGDDIEVDFDQVDKILKRAELEGFGGMCAEAAIAMNEVIFGGKGKLVAAVNKKLWEEGRFLGHVAVEWEGSYWDADGEKTWDEIESWGMVDENDEDYSFENKDDLYNVERIYPTEEELYDMFGGCNLEDLKRALYEAKAEVSDE